VKIRQAGQRRLCETSKDEGMAKEAKKDAPGAEVRLRQERTMSNLPGVLEAP
jgi:hypothetical protein